MSGFSVYTDNGILNQIFKGTAFVAPSARYLALFTTDAGLETNTQAQWTEISGAGYARVTQTNDTMEVAANSSIKNSASYSFPVASADWGTVGYFAIMDAAVDGNVIGWGPIRNPITGAIQTRNIVAGDQFSMAAGSLVVSIANNI